MPIHVGVSYKPHPFLCKYLFLYLVIQSLFHKVVVKVGVLIMSVVIMQVYGNEVSVWA